jgi:hypothetical protein
VIAKSLTIPILLVRGRHLRPRSNDLVTLIPDIPPSLLWLEVSALDDDSSRAFLVFAGGSPRPRPNGAAAAEAFPANNLPCPGTVRINLLPGDRSRNARDTSGGLGRSLRDNPGGSLDRCPNRRSGPLRRRIPLEDEASAGLVIGGVGPEEIDPHPFQLLGAIGREGLDVFIVETPLVLLPKHHGEFRTPGEAPRPLPQFGLERLGILAEGVVEKSHIPRHPRADRPAGRGQLQRPPLPHPPRQRIGPVFRSEETAHAPVVGVEDDP